MSKKWYRQWRYIIPAAVVAAPFVIAAVVALSGGIVMCFEYPPPPLFGWPSITLLQGFGLLALCRILFGGFGSGGGGGGGYSKHMTPEERERFRQRMSERSCRSAGESAES